MSKTTTTRARIEPEVKEEAERILNDCGLNASQAISLFYRQVILERGLPFKVKSFNEETRRVLRDSERGIEVEQFESAEALFEDLGIEQAARASPPPGPDHQVQTGSRSVQAARVRHGLGAGRDGTTDSPRTA